MPKKKIPKHPKHPGHITLSRRGVHIDRHHHFETILGLMSSSETFEGLTHSQWQRGVTGRAVERLIFLIALIARLIILIAR